MIGNGRLGRRLRRRLAAVTVCRRLRLGFDSGFFGVRLLALAAVGGAATSSAKAYSCDPNLTTPRNGFSDWYLGSFLTIRLNASACGDCPDLPAATGRSHRQSSARRSTAAGPTNTWVTSDRGNQTWFRAA